MAIHPLDALRAAADHHELLFENDRVRILDTRASPRVSEPRFTRTNGPPRFTC